MDARMQVNTLFEHTMQDLREESLRLWAAQNEVFPPAPRLRVSIRYITAEMGLEWHNTFKGPGPAGSSLRCFRKQLSGSKTGRKQWRAMEEKSWIALLIDMCNTPRKAARALSRLDAFMRWMGLRVEGLKQARQNILDSQKEWVARLDSRIGMAELAGESLTKGTSKFSHTGPAADWPENLKAALGNQNTKILAIKICRELTGFGLADAKNWVEHAYKVLEQHGAYNVYGRHDVSINWWFVK